MLSARGIVHWHEGLFLRPHHLQLMQRQCGESMAVERRLMTPFPWGVIEAQYSPDELGNMFIRFQRLSVVMRSGLLVDVPGNAELPRRDVTERFQASSSPLTVYLAVPDWSPNRGNTVDSGPLADQRLKRLFVTDVEERFDENTGENPEPIQIRRINARLLFDDEDDTDLEILPVMRIRHGAAGEESAPRPDERFVPPCFVLGANAWLLNQVRDVANAVDAARRELQGALVRDGFNIDNIRPGQLDSVLRLRSLSTFGTRLLDQVEAPTTTPFEMYLQLKSLLAELISLRPAEGDLDVPDYNHDSPYVPFAELIERLRQIIKPAPEGTLLKVDFTRDDRYFWATLDDDHFREGNRHYLAVKTSRDPQVVAGLIQDQRQFQLLPGSWAHRALPGFRLMEQRQLPPRLPLANDVHYFLVRHDEDEDLWGRVQDDRKLFAAWKGAEAADFELSLCTLGQ